jgi:predicted transcriptional regulator of viral defense system
MNETVGQKIKHYIQKHGEGWVFTSKDLVDFVSEDAVHVALHRLKEKGEIERVSHGIYYFPKKNELLGKMPPDVRSVAKAIADKYKIRIQPSGAYAANLLGLSEQVPAKVVYLTDGEEKKIKIGKMELILKKTTPKNMAMAGKISGLVVQALKYLGQEHIDDKKINIIKQKLSDTDKKILQTDARLAPVWISTIINTQILEGFNG